jgi:phosphopantetheinyl transferase
MASRVLAKQCAAEFSSSKAEDWRVERSETGVPSLCYDGQIAQKLHVSISHAKGYCAVAVANGPNGVDLQFKEPLQRWRGIESKVFSLIELAAIKRQPDNLQSAAYSEIWALKEAHGKFHEHGLKIQGTRNISFICTADHEAKSLVALSIQLESHVLAIYADNLFEFSKLQLASSHNKMLKAWRVQS